MGQLTNTEQLRLKNLSASSLKLWLMCPRCWERKYYGERSEIIDGKDSVTGPLLFGRAMAVALEELHLLKSDGFSTFSNEWNRLHKLSIEKRLPIPSPGVDEGINFLKQYKEFGVFQGVPERRFTINIKGLAVPIKGIIDLETWHWGKPAGIVEFKTSMSKTWTQERVDSEIQGFCYWMAFFTLYNRVPDHMTYVVFDTKTNDMKVFETRRTKEQCKEALEEFNKALKGIESGEFEEKCRHCKNLRNPKKLPTFNVSREL